MRTTRLR